MRAGGRTLLQRAIAAAGDARRTVVVGPHPAQPLPTAVMVAREDPPFGGPAAAVGAGLDALRRQSGPDDVAPWILVLACDMPHAAGAVPALLAAMPKADGAIARDGVGRLQPLLALYARAALAAAVQSRRDAGTLAGAAMFGLVRTLALTPVAVPTDATADVDTWEDAARLGVQRPAGIHAPTVPGAGVPAAPDRDR